MLLFSVRGLYLFVIIVLGEIKPRGNCELIMVKTKHCPGALLPDTERKTDNALIVVLVPVLVKASLFQWQLQAQNPHLIPRIQFTH